MSFPELDDEPTEQEPAHVCPQCAQTFATSNALGGHMSGAHRANRPPKQTKVLRSRPTKQPRTLGLQAAVVDWLTAHPGLHNWRDIAAQLGRTGDDQIIKSLSAAKSRGYPVGNDGHGNWRYLPEGHGLAVRASDRPAPKPEPVAQEHWPQAVLAQANGGGHQFKRVDSFVVLEDEDGGIWLAERIK